MPRVTVLVGTRKGCFLLESDERPPRLGVRGPYCEGWPIYHAVHDAESGALYAAAASEWHGAGVWRSGDLGETWKLSSEGLGTRRRRPQAVEALRPDGGARPRARRRRGGGRLREPRRRRDLVAPLDARRAARPRRLERPGQPAAGPPRPAGDPAAPRRADALLGDRPGLRHLRDDRRRRVVDAAQPRPARRLAARATRRSATASTSSSCRRPTASACTSRTTAACTGATTPAQSWVEITEGLPTEFGFAAAAHPHDRDTFYVIPLDPGHGRCMPDGHAAVWRTRDAGSTLAAARRRPAAARRAPRRAARGHGDRRATTSPASTSARAPARCSRAPTRARRWSEIASYLPGDRVGRGRGRSTDGRRSTCPPRCRRSSPTCRASSRSRRPRWARRSTASTSAGPGCATGSASPGPTLRPHINVYVDRERAALDTPLEPGSRVDVIAAISGG